MTLSRRRFLELLAIAGGAALFRKNAHAAARPMLPATAERVILLWLAGGAAHTETFDPKPRTPFARGIMRDTIASTFGSIPTALDGVRFSEGLEETAAILDRGALIRSFRAPELDITDHTRHQYHWHTGYVPPQGVPLPHLGSVVAKLKGDPASPLPPFVHIGQRLDGRPADQLRAFLTAGFLGAEYAPLLVARAAEASRAIQPAEGLDPTRVESRSRFLKRLLAEGRTPEFATPEHGDSLVRSLERAQALLASPARRAFDLDQEPSKNREGYGPGQFASGCLLARRLSEAGVKFVEVSSEYVPFDRWDTHQRGHERTKSLKAEFDRPFATLVKELDERGLLDTTLVIVASEFSRASFTQRAQDADRSEDLSPLLERPEQYGLHFHYIGAGSVLMFGGGMKQGHVHGETDVEPPCPAVSDIVGVSDLHATVYRALGIPPDFSFELERRPIYVTRDGLGVAIPGIGRGWR